MHELPWITIFWQITSRVTKKSLITVTNVLFYFLHAISYLEHTVPLRTMIDRGAKRGNFLSLKAYRIKCLAVEVFKCVHGFNPTYLNRLFTEPLANYNLRDRRRLNQPRFHTYTYGFRSFRYSGSKLWNSLPRAIKNTNDINEFKKNITEWCQTCDLTKMEIF